MPVNYATLNAKKFLNASGLGYFYSKLNTIYPTIDDLSIIIDSIQDVLDEKMFVEEYDEYEYFPASGEDKTIYIDTSTSALYRWNGSAFVRLNPLYTPITSSEIDALFE